MTFLLAIYAAITMTAAQPAQSFDDACRDCIDMFCHLECGGVLQTCGECIQEHCSFQC